MVEKLIKYYSKESIHNRYNKQLSGLVLFFTIFLIIIIILFNILFSINKLSINFFKFYTIISLLSFVIIIGCIIKLIREFLKKYNISSFSKIKSETFEIDKIKIKKFLINNNLYSKDKINILIKEINNHVSLKNNKEKVVTMALILTNIISTGFFIINYRDQYNSINYNEAIEKAIIVYFVASIIYVFINISYNNIIFFIEMLNDIRNKNVDYKMLIHILNDIMITEDFNNETISVSNIIKNKIKSLIKL